VFIFSFSIARGGVSYTLRHDKDSIAAAVDTAEPSDVARLFCRLMTTGGVDGGLNPVETKALVKKVADRAKAGVRDIAQMLKDARQQKRGETAEARRKARVATSARTLLDAAPQDAPIKPEMERWDAVLRSIKAPEPPMRDLDGWPVHAREREPLGVLHELTSDGANDDESELSRLPPPCKPC